jgi:hypothetical protein
MAARAIVGCVLALCCTVAHAAESTAPVLERPTLRCLGTYWVLPGDVTGVEVEVRAAGTASWRNGPPLFRVERGKHVAEKFGSRVTVPEGSTLWAGSVVDLPPDTPYELRLTPQPAGSAKVLSARTRGEPSVAADAPVRHVIPGGGGGSGTAHDPFKGLAAAQAAARPGDVFLLAAGTYAGTFDVTKSGEEGRPIVWRGADAQTVILDAKGAAPKRPARAITANDRHDVWFERLTIRNADHGIVAHDAARIVVRGCRIDGVDYGVTATRNDKDNCRDFLVADNVIEGPSTWPRSKGIEDARGVQLTGAGHVVCYNRVRGFADAIDTYPSSRVEAIDFHNNDCLDLTDDGVELDYAHRNVRCFENRFTNVFQGISVQPVTGGPVYVFRNALYNVQLEPFKIHNGPSGALFYHNTVVKAGPAMLVYTPAPASNLVMRNNLFVGGGSPGGYAWECQPPMTDCDFDYDGFAPGEHKQFLKWNGKRYATFDEMRATAPIERHATLVDAATAFASGARPPADAKARQADPPDLLLGPRSTAVDVGAPLPGFNDAAAGKAPDLGAYELGSPLPQYGPRQGVNGPTTAPRR